MFSPLNSEELNYCIATERSRNFPKEEKPVDCMSKVEKMRELHYS
jgi:hypothetical protein